MHVYIGRSHLKNLAAQIAQAAYAYAHVHLRLHLHLRCIDIHMQGDISSTSGAISSLPEATPGSTATSEATAAATAAATATAAAASGLREEELLKLQRAAAGAVAKVRR